MFGELSCKSCGSRAYVKDRPWVSYVDLPFGGTPTRLLWKKHPMVCRNDDCETKTWTMGDHRISALGCFLSPPGQAMNCPEFLGYVEFGITKIPGAYHSNDPGRIERPA